MTTRCSSGNSRGLFEVLSGVYRVERRKQIPTTYDHAVPSTTHQGKAMMTVPVSSCHHFSSPKSTTDEIMATTLVIHHGAVWRLFGLARMRVGKKGRARPAKDWAGVKRCRPGAIYQMAPIRSSFRSGLGITSISPSSSMLSK